MIRHQALLLLTPMSFPDSDQGDLADVARPRTAADSSSDSNIGGSRRPTTSRSGGGVEVKNAYQRR
jgi:hypothetical protein